MWLNETLGIQYPLIQGLANLRQPFRMLAL